MLNWLPVATQKSLILVAAFFLAGRSAADGGYSVTKKIPIPGQGSFNYLTVDEAARRLYVSHGTHCWQHSQNTRGAWSGDRARVWPRFCQQRTGCHCDDLRLEDAKADR